MMLENKYLKFFLFTAVAVIYTVVIYRWVEYSKSPSPQVMDNLPSIQSLNTYEKPDLTYPITKKNPFNQKLRPKAQSQSPVVKKQFIPEKSIVNKQSRMVTYHGLVNSSKSKLFYVKVEGSIYEMKIGQMYDGIILLEVTDSNVKMKVDGQVRLIPILNKSP